MALMMFTTVVVVRFLVLFPALLSVVFLMVVLLMMMRRPDISASVMASVLSAPSVIVRRRIYDVSVGGESHDSVSGIDSEHYFRTVCGSFRQVRNHWSREKDRACDEKGKVSFHSIVVYEVRI